MKNRNDYNKEEETAYLLGRRDVLEWIRKKRPDHWARDCELEQVQDAITRLWSEEEEVQS